MPYLNDEIQIQESFHRVWSGIVAENAVDTQDRVAVVIPGMDSTIRWEDCRWPTRSDSTAPQRGDECVVVVDDNNEMWIVNWWPQNPQAPGGGSAGTIINGVWRWTTSTTGAASGQVGINTAAFSTATQMNIADTTDSNNDVTNYLNSIQPGDTLYVQQQNDSTKWGQYKVSAGGVDQGTYHSFPVTYVNSGTGGLPGNNQTCNVTLSIPAPPGPAGPTGPQGPQGTAGVGVPAGGASNTLLAKNSPTDYDTHWIPAPVALPPGGTIGQSLTKKTLADGDAQWTTLDNLHYLGDYASASYVEGDVVVYNGVAYVCVAPTASPPTAWPGMTPQDLSAFQAKSEKTVANGYPSLDSGGKVPLAQLPPVGADLRYDGDWAAGSYTDGDIVVYNGLAYMAVRPTTNPPTPWTPGGIPPLSYGTSLPTSPVDGQEAILVDSVTAPNWHWRFRYNAGSTNPYKWEFIGGIPMSYGTFAGTTITSATYADFPSGTMAGTGPVVPRAGVYNVTMDARCDNAADGQQTIVSFKIGANAASDANCINHRTGNWTDASRTTPATCLAGDRLTLQAKTTMSGGRVLQLEMYILPVRIN